MEIIFPSIGEDGEAKFFLAILPERKANLPASTASFMARAIAIGFLALAFRD